MYKRVGNKDYQHLLGELASIGGDLLVQVLRDIRNGTVRVATNGTFSC